ncbi:MAG TPA: CBS domain-containing protein [Gaiellaceae bacterium]|nr:CBS domain-containing protein [Gaiellaceae bacterium]
MLKPFDLAARSLLIVGGLNWLSIAAGKVDFVAEAARSRFGRPNLAARTVYGVVGGAALWSLSRLIEQEAFPKRPRATSSGASPRQRLQVREVMSAQPATVAPSTAVVEAARLMKQHDVGSLPVVEGGRLSGMITDRDIALRVVADGRDPDGVTVADIASGDLATIRPDQELDDALRLMAKQQVRRLPVVENDRLVGILAQADVARTADDARAGDLLEEISR